MSEENIMERKWRPQSYLVRDENGLKRLIVKEISPFRTLPWKTLYLVLWIGLWFLLWENSREFHGHNGVLSNKL